MYFIVFSVFCQYFAIQLRSAAFKTNSDPQGCGVRPADLLFLIARVSRPDVVVLAIATLEIWITTMEI